MFERVAIVGPGLIGGSMGLALKERGLAGTVVGVGRRQSSLDKALRVGAIDRDALDLKKGVAGAELVVLATPIRALQQLAPELAGCLEAEALVTDVASTKVGVIDAISSGLRNRPDVAYIPTHPMAGSEKSGPLAAEAGLFEDSVCIVTPLPNTFADCKSTITRLWEALGARVRSMSPQAHDRLVARISHVPHLAAAALLNYLDADETDLCGGGLRDTTRIAAGDPELWMDICRENRREIAGALNAYLEGLRRMKQALDSGALGELRELLKEAKSKRDAMGSP